MCHGREKAVTIYNMLLFGAILKRESIYGSKTLVSDPMHTPKAKEESTLL
jgi:hypothetical protein